MPPTSAVRAVGQGPQRITTVVTRSPSAVTLIAPTSLLPWGTNERGIVNVSLGLLGIRTQKSLRVNLAGARTMR